MTLEEKAKAYNEALERASKLRFQNPFDTVSQMVEHVFPELKESEDERIRKAIVEMILDTPNVECEENYNVRKEDALAWLEKQCKPMWTEEDEETMQHCCGAVAAADYYTMEDKEEMENWLKSLKQRMEVQQ